MALQGERGVGGGGGGVNTQKHVRWFGRRSKAVHDDDDEGDGVGPLSVH